MTKLRKLKTIPEVGRVLGTGFSRTAYVKKSNPKRVIKVVTFVSHNDSQNIFHKEQHRREVRRANKSFVFAKAYAYGNDWIEMERCKTSLSLIKKKMRRCGFSDNDIWHIEMQNYQAVFPKALKHPIIQELIRLRKKMKLRDITQLQNWGVNSRGSLRLIDFGCVA